MSRLFSRRRLVISAGGAAALAPFAATLAGAPAPAAAAPGVTGPLVVLRSPERLFDSRITPPSLGGGKLAVGNSVAVTVTTDLPANQFLAAAFINVTVTETEGSGYLVVRPSDLSGEVPLPSTSNINWSTAGQTLANLVLSAIGGENAVEVHAGGGGGRTHVVVDLQGYMPITF